MAMLNIVGQQLTKLTAYNEYITDVIISVIVYLSAFSLVIRMLLTSRKKAGKVRAKGDDKTEKTAAQPEKAEGEKGGENS